ncbi:hypothetical protein COT79_01350 [Candidatus Berkelbacteria bacterium CG10_big_fil_rev_8_21_14_0_10_43_14]|uniref:Uncharacterized protein n=1 Tax=Candidatus Berkelbacteria bacterium CG10_big_fil_rev_8_21_14_0_10_43_14 TaxID=1974515 RepID=A0A2M6R986_9BACT|nr:MAG: hypothetical protein COT79_01350 [Candidatus Berkelbacteria bacterium CG10_big_fil_rev_8_21_14_0_10_43_14]
MELVFWSLILPLKLPFGAIGLNLSQPPPNSLPANQPLIPRALLLIRMSAEKILLPKLLMFLDQDQFL